MINPEVLRTWPGLFSVSVIALFVVLSWRRHGTAIRRIPGPFFASITRLWHVRYILRGDQNAELVRLHDKHGHFVRIAPDEVSVSHPDGIKKLLLAPLHKGYWYKFLAFPDWRFQTPMSSTDPKVKIARSKCFAAGYSMTSVLDGEKDMDAVIGTFFTWMDNFATLNQPVKFNWWFSFVASDVIGEKLFSEQFGFLKEGLDVGNALATTGMLNSYAAFGGFYRYIHMALFGNPFMMSFLPMGHLFDTSMAALDKRRKNRDSRFDMVSHWLRALEKNPHMTGRDVDAMVTGVVGAGSETVSCGMQSFVYHMNRLPGAWAQAQVEIDEARARGYCGDAIISYEDTQRLPFVQACIKESLRIFTPVPMTLPRVAPQGGITIGNQTFPAGTILSVSPWVVHYSEEFWGTDAREFRPNRWLEEGIAEKERKSYIPFGAGYNSCPGSHIAKVEMSKILTTMVRDYDVFVGKEEWKWNAYFILAPTEWAGQIRRRTT